MTRSSPRIEQFDVVAFDADDTLWKSEDSFQDAEARFAELVDPYAPVGIDVLDALHAVERLDIASQGYGVKAFTLSMVRAAIDMTEDAVPSAVIRELVEIGGPGCSSSPYTCSRMFPRYSTASAHTHGWS